MDNPVIVVTIVKIDGQEIHETYSREDQMEMFAKDMISVAMEFSAGLIKSMKFERTDLNG